MIKDVMQLGFVISMIVLVVVIVTEHFKDQKKDD
jgi:hypothetical protein